MNRWPFTLHALSEFFGRLSRPFLMVVAFALIVRLVFVIGTAYWPIPNENGFPVSILRLAGSLDMWMYHQGREIYFGGRFGELVDALIAFYSTEDLSRAKGLLISAPMFPFLLHVFDYFPGRTLHAGIFFWIVGVLLAGVWLKWLDNRKVPTLWLMAFALLPHSIWFSVNLGTDLLGAVFFAGFFLCYFGIERQGTRLSASLVFIVLALLTRPDSVSLAIFFVLDQLLFDRSLSARNRFLVMALAVVIFIPFAIFYIPYARTFVVGSVGMTFFQIPESEYLSGLLDALPYWLNVALSWLALLGAKVLYFVGLRPSYSGTAFTLLLFRSLPGLILLPGLIWFYWRAPRSEKLLITLYLLPVLSGAAQDRYSLPIQPILFYYCYLAYEEFLNLVRGHLARATTR